MAIFVTPEMIQESTHRALRESPTLAGKLHAIKLVVFDFDGVFTDNSVTINQDGKESVRCNRSETYGLQQLKEEGVEFHILSTEINPIVLHRAKKLGIPCKNNLSDKGAALKDLMAGLGVKREEVLCVGNDINDLAWIDIAGIFIAVADAYQTVAAKVTYVTRAKGGHGAVREVLELLILARSK